MCNYRQKHMPPMVDQGRNIIIQYEQVCQVLAARPRLDCPLDSTTSSWQVPGPWRSWREEDGPALL
jgi:hypothetical protein